MIKTFIISIIACLITLFSLSANASNKCISKEEAYFRLGYYEFSDWNIQEFHGQIVDVLAFKNSLGQTALDVRLGRGLNDTLDDINSKLSLFVFYSYEHQDIIYKRQFINGTPQKCFIKIVIPK